MGGSLVRWVEAVHRSSRKPVSVAVVMYLLPWWFAGCHGSFFVVLASVRCCAAYWLLYMNQCFVSSYSVEAVDIGVVVNEPDFLLRGWQFNSSLQGQNDVSRYLLHLFPLPSSAA